MLSFIDFRCFDPLVICLIFITFLFLVYFLSSRSEEYDLLLPLRYFVLISIIFSSMFMFLELESNAFHNLLRTFIWKMSLFIIYIFILCIDSCDFMFELKNFVSIYMQFSITSMFLKFVVLMLLCFSLNFSINLFSLIVSIVHGILFFLRYLFERFIMKMAYSHTKLHNMEHWFVFLECMKFRPNSQTISRPYAYSYVETILYLVIKKTLLYIFPFSYGISICIMHPCQFPIPRNLLLHFCRCIFLYSLMKMNHYALLCCKKSMKLCIVKNKHYTHSPITRILFQNSF